MKALIVAIGILEVKKPINLGKPTVGDCTAVVRRGSKGVGASITGRRVRKGKPIQTSVVAEEVVAEGVVATEGRDGNGDQDDGPTRRSGTIWLGAKCGNRRRAYHGDLTEGRFKNIGKGVGDWHQVSGFKTRWADQHGTTSPRKSKKGTQISQIRIGTGIIRWGMTRETRLPGLKLLAGWR